MNLLSKMYGGSLRPRDPRRYLVEAIVGAMQADGKVTDDELAVLERNLQEHEMFSGLSGDVTRMLIDMARDSIYYAGSPLKRLPYIARGLHARSHRMAAYAVACEITFADGEAREEIRYLDGLRAALLLSDDEARALMAAARKHRGMQEVEERTRRVSGLLPWYLDLMALMASSDGTVTEAERRAVREVLGRMGDMAMLGEHEVAEHLEAAFARIGGKDPDRQLHAAAEGLETPVDRFWAAVYMSVVAVVEGFTDWRRVWLLQNAQDILALSDDKMHRAMEIAQGFVIVPPPE